MGAVVVFGATGGVGRHAVGQLLGAGQDVIAVVRYWEGAVDVHGSGAGSPTGVGYVELTGYAPPVPSSQ